MVVGPFQSITLVGGGQADLYLLRYDDAGRLRSPLTEQHIKEHLSGISDVFVFSHGWNTIFSQALGRYRDFIAGYMDQRQKFGVGVPDNYRPLLIGVIWPSTSLVLPWEAGPAIAAAPDPDGPEARQVEEMLAYVTDGLDPAADAEFTELVDGRTELDGGEARRAAEILLGALRPGADPDGGAAAPDAEEFLRVWAQLDGVDGPPPVDPDAPGIVGGTANTAEPSLAGGFSLDPRNLLRGATVWKMKDRAGKVGANGVGPLVRHVLQHSTARLHLIGHSFGARVVLSALASGAVSRPAHSVLLLQAAINRWCFAPDVAGTGRAGGYHPVLDRVERPILSTFSSHDEPLRTFFHLALRGGHVGEPDIAGIGDPELYGALGGYGPGGLGDLAGTVSAAAPDTDRYRATGRQRVIAIDGGTQINGGPAISGHGDISNAVTWWALHCLTAEG